MDSKRDLVRRCLMAREERPLPPLPVAVDIREADFAQPLQLCLDVQELVGTIFVLGADGDGIEKLPVRPRRGRGDMLEITEDAARIEDRPDLAIQVPLSGMRQVMDRETRDDGIKSARFRKGGAPCCNPGSRPDRRCESALSCVRAWVARSPARRHAHRACRA
jgi:hypothetical protein